MVVLLQYEQRRVASRIEVSRSGNVACSLNFHDQP